jgi:xanthine/uracil permease
MNNFLIVGFLVVLIGLTLLAVRMWYTRRGADVSEAERRVFARYMLGLGVLWLVAVVAYFAGPLLSMIK